MERPGKAPIEPPVIDASGGTPLPLLAAIDRIVTCHREGAVAVVGPMGSGRKTALRLIRKYLKSRDPGMDWGQSRTSFSCRSSDGDFVFRVLPIAPKAALLATLRMIPWRTDEWFEYLLLANREQCGSVMTRLQKDPTTRLLFGLPGVCVPVFELMAKDQSVSSVREAMTILTTGPGSDEGARRAGRLAFADLNGAVESDGTQPAGRIARLFPIKLHLAARHVVEELAAGRELPEYAGDLATDLMDEIAALIRDRESAANRLRSTLADNSPRLGSAAAGILHRAGLPFRPVKSYACLNWAMLDGIDWLGVELDHPQLNRADLAGARLAGATLRRASLVSADLRGADLCGATLRKADARGADFSDADLLYAELISCDLTGACIDGADFRNADLTGSNLSGLRLCAARLEGAIFTEVILSHCDLSEVQLEQADFRKATLCGADLTRSSLAGADLSSADLKGARLAGIDWEGATLCHANLTECIFQFGSTRCGMLDSPIASEGTRTGFYADDPLYQSYHRPEEYRKANLRGADLYGCKVDRTDFYLVDLRDAKYTDAQWEHFRRCGAIL